MSFRATCRRGTHRSGRRMAGRQSNVLPPSATSWRSRVQIWPTPATRPPVATGALASLNSHGSSVVEPMKRAVTSMVGAKCSRSPRWARVADGHESRSIRISDRQASTHGSANVAVGNELHPRTGRRLRRLAVLPVVDPLGWSLLDVPPERMSRWPILLHAEQLLGALEVLGVGHVVRAERGVMLQPVEVAVDTPHRGDEQWPALLGDPGGDRGGDLGVPIHLDVDVDRFAAPGADEVCVDRRGAGASAGHARRPQCDRCEVAAVRPPDLPVGRQVTREGRCVGLLDGGVGCEITHRPILADASTDTPASFPTMQPTPPLGA